jgi:DNA-binding GntR family transcriptional regulator
MIPITSEAAETAVEPWRMSAPLLELSEGARCSLGKWPLAANACSEKASKRTRIKPKASTAAGFIVLGLLLDGGKPRSVIYETYITSAAISVLQRRLHQNAPRPASSRNGSGRKPSTTERRRPPPQPQRADTLTEQAYQIIEEAIVTLRLAPGQVLSEQILSATCKIGRTPIREALQRLAREGLVTILPRKGILVSDLNPRQQLLLLEVRRELERLLSRTGAERATPQQRGSMRAIAQGMDQAAKRNDDVAFMRLDRELNQLILQAAHNDYASRSMKLLQGLSRRFWYMHYRQAADLPLCARLHAGQARAIAEGNAEAAARSSDKLMDYVESFTRATVSV